MCQEIDFDGMTEEIKILDRYEGVQVLINKVGQSDESIALNATYLGKVHIRRKDTLKIKEQFSLTDQSTIIAMLLDGTE